MACLCIPSSANWTLFLKSNAQQAEWKCATIESNKKGWTRSDRDVISVYSVSRMFAGAI